MITFDASFWKKAHAAELAEWPELQAAAQRLLADDWARTTLEGIEAGDRLQIGGPNSDWRRLIDIADVNSFLKLPNLGAPVHWWVTAPVIVAARKMLAQPPNANVSPEVQKLLEDGVFPLFLCQLALNDEKPDRVKRGYFYRRRWYLSTILPAWSDYARNEDISAITRDLEVELDLCGDLNGGHEAAMRASDLLGPHLLHHGVVDGDYNMFVIPFEMDRAGVDVCDNGAMSNAISKTPRWQSLFREYGK
jgi:hypothetical protein